MQGDSDPVVINYLANGRNRAIFERASWLAEVAGTERPQELVSYLLGEEFRAVATRELDEIAPKWERFLRTPVQRILDAGCGPGVTTVALANRYPTAEVLGVDVELPAIELARHLARDNPRCQFEERPIEMLDEEGFDVIQCREVIEHVYDPRFATQRLIHLLRPGGVAYIETPNYLWPWEPHVRLPMLPRSPKWLLATECRLTGRDPAFVAHLNFDCNPVSMKRWIRRADPSVHIVDLMREKVDAIFAARERPRVARRGRAVDRMRRIPPVARGAAWILKNVPVTPSVMLVVTRPQI
jgi:2-polyprenyl-3-methyl-5-hydroxy-6-metoxy-1,4-benzoquinol methylase